MNEMHLNRYCDDADHGWGEHVLARVNPGEWKDRSDAHDPKIFRCSRRPFGRERPFGYSDERSNFQRSAAKHLIRNALGFLLGEEKLISPKSGKANVAYAFQFRKELNNVSVAELKDVLKEFHIFLDPTVSVYARPGVITDHDELLKLLDEKIKQLQGEENQYDEILADVISKYPPAEEDDDGAAVGGADMFGGGDDDY